MELKLGELTLNFTDAENRVNPCVKGFVENFNSGNKMNLEFNKINPARTSLGTLCEDAVKHLGKLNGQWKCVIKKLVSLGGNVGIHDGGCALKIIFPSHCGIVANLIRKNMVFLYYDFLMDNSYRIELDSEEGINRVIMPQALHVTTTIFHELGHMLGKDKYEACNLSCDHKLSVRISEDADTNFEAKCAFGDNVSMEGTYVKKYLQNRYKYHDENNTNEISSVILELYTFFSLLTFEKSEPSWIKLLRDDVETKLGKILDCSK